MKDILRLAAVALSLTLAVPVGAVPKEAQKAATVSKKKEAQARQPAPKAVATAAPVALPVQAAADQAPAPTAVAPAPVPAESGPSTVQTINPYLAGWFKPTEISALPAMVAGQMNSNARYLADALTSLPEKVTGALPSIKTVHPTGGRDLVVAIVKCPAEMVTGQYLFPTNVLREGINGLFERLNESQFLTFDIQLVCS